MTILFLINVMHSQLLFAKGRIQVEHKNYLQKRGYINLLINDCTNNVFLQFIHRTQICIGWAEVLSVARLARFGICNQNVFPNTHPILQLTQKFP